MNSTHFSDELKQSPVDAVITWVDGNDPRHIAKRKSEYGRLQKLSLTAIPGGRHATRFADSGELRHCLLSIRKYCPWVRTIFLVTDDQVPEFLRGGLAEKLGLRIVDHKEIFRGYEWALPTFNSQSIESMLHRIVGLADRFVYFNDDVMVLRSTSPEEFFSPNGVVLRGEWRRLPDFGWPRIFISSATNHFFDKVVGRVRSMAVLAQYRAAQLAGFHNRFFQAPHTPHPLRKGTLSNYFDQNPGVLARNIRYKFRDMEQFAPVPLANHLEIRAKQYLEKDCKDYKIICFNRDSRASIDARILEVSGGAERFLCVQGFEHANASQRARLLAMFDGLGIGES